MFNKIKSKLKSRIDNQVSAQVASQLAPTFPNLNANVIELNNFQELKKVFGWKGDPILDRPDIDDFDYIEDVNERRKRDSESIATVMQNAQAKVALEIGTANGMGTVLMAANAPKTKIYTINIEPEEALTGAGGKLITVAMQKEEIGIEFRKRKLTNVEQIYANTATWEPNIGMIDVAFIDGSHDSEFVYNDTKKVLSAMEPGDFILWHDFNLELAPKYNWIGSVCAGVERLCAEGYVKGRIFHIRDSWVGIYRVGQ
ncbi:MAG: class I SAM-dependent methyltransferase [Candidatus Doudnabacteria bacterium]|nr:class I SAM-dependent methyltransferase [Candidatus Doudnabacteria bacterium]